MAIEKTCVSLFSSGGIGDLAIASAGYTTVVSNELLDERHQVYRANFPGVECLTGDIWKHQAKIVDAALGRLKGRQLDLFFATPPCQGMSKNGRGKLLSAIRAGAKPAVDPRNLLILPTVEIAKRLQPRSIVLENVPEMRDTLIPSPTGEFVTILDYISRELPEYHLEAKVIEFADYGVPQRRQRLITILSRHEQVLSWVQEHRTLFAKPTHSRECRRGTAPWVTVREAIEHLPPLDAGRPETARSTIPYHRVPLLDSKKHWWVSHTPPESCAFDNQCARCGFDENPTHAASRDRQGINRAHDDTPVHCRRCGALLPRPCVEEGGGARIMKGFTSAYKRMPFDQPASTLTRNLSYACSDNKLHPTQNRVLSLHEAFILHTLDQFPFQWKRGDGKRVSDKVIREVIGESIPPAGLLRLLQHLSDIESGTAKFPRPRLGRQRELFPA